MGCEPREAVYSLDCFVSRPGNRRRPEEVWTVSGILYMYVRGATALYVVYVYDVRAYDVYKSVMDHSELSGNAF